MWENIKTCKNNTTYDVSALQHRKTSIRHGYLRHIRHPTPLDIAQTFLFTTLRLFGITKTQKQSYVPHFAPSIPHKHSKTQLFMTTSPFDTTQFKTTVLLTTIVCSSHSLIFPSESLCWFELCLRFDSAPFWLPYLSFEVSALLRTVLWNQLCTTPESQYTCHNCDSRIFPSESLSWFKLCFRTDRAQFRLPYLSFEVTALSRTVLPNRLCTTPESQSTCHLRTYIPTYMHT